MSKPLLYTENVTVVFQGVKAADDVNLSIYPGEFLSIIGPNGSGKTTFLNLCTGYVHPASGQIYLDGHRITRLQPKTITKRGIARAFQIPELFADRTLVENLMLAIAARTRLWQPFRSLVRPAYRDEAMALLELAGLEAVAKQLAVELPEGMRKLADILLALALKPRLLLLDEPTSSVSAEEKYGLMETLMGAVREQEVTTLFVEHDMDIVRKYADRVVVWDSGQVVSDGSPDSVLSDPQVIENVVGVA